MFGYLNRLKKRMVFKGFLHDDELLNAVVKAAMAMHELHVAAHYLTRGEVAAVRAIARMTPIAPKRQLNDGASATTIIAASTLV